MKDRNCYNCFWGGDGEEIDDYGHCWLNNGDAGYQQPPKEDGCNSWSPKEDAE